MKIIETLDNIVCPPGYDDDADFRFLVLEKLPQTETVMILDTLWLMERSIKNIN
jgi:hypothetical protein